jgi:hypothetical protein
MGGELELLICIVLELLNRAALALLLEVLVTLSGALESARTAAKAASTTAIVTAIPISLLYSAKSLYHEQTLPSLTIHCYALGS